MFKKLFHRRSSKTVKPGEPEAPLEPQGQAKQVPHVDNQQRTQPQQPGEQTYPQPTGIGKPPPLKPKALPEAPNQPAQPVAPSPARRATVHPGADGGASLYRRLQIEAEERAKARERGELAASVGPSFAMRLPGSSEALKVVASQSQAVRTTRLMKEFERIQKSQSVQDGVFSVELADDNLFEWDLRFYKFDPDSLLAFDLAHFKREYGIDNVWFRVSFPENFPFAPPFVRVLAPLVQGGYVLTGGAICLELLTPQGWVQGCKMEVVIMQIAAGITQGGARIVLMVPTEFSEAEARKSYDYLVKTHAKYGWKELAKEDG